MNARPRAEWIYIVLGIVAGLVVTVGAMASGSSEAIVGIALCWVALIAFIAMERFVDRISGFTWAGQRRTASGAEMSRGTEMRGRGRSRKPYRLTDSAARLAASR